MSRLLSSIFMLMIFAVNAFALNGLAAEQEANFLSGKLHMCYGAGKTFFEPDADDAANLEYFSEEDKTVVAFYDLLAKHSMGLSYSVPGMAVYKYLTTSLDENHYMSQIVRSLFNADLKESLSLCKRAMESVADIYGEESWEYSYLLNIKGQRHVLLGESAEAEKAFKKYFEINAANGRENWWLNPIVYSYYAVSGLMAGNEASALANIESMSKAVLDQPEDIVRFVGIVPYMNVLYVYHSAGGWNEALDLSRQVCGWVEKSGLENTEVHAYSRQCIGIGLTMTGKAKEALAIFDDVKKEYKRLGIDNCNYAVTLKNWTKHAKSKK